MPVGKIIFVIGSIMYSAVALSDTVYLRSPEPCLVPAYTAPGGNLLPEKLPCDAKVTIVERQGSYLRVKTSNGRVVWVDDGSTTDEVPADLEVQRLTEYQKKIEAELDVLTEQVNRLSRQSEKLLEALLASKASAKKSPATE